MGQEPAERGSAGAVSASRRVATVPNLLSAIRILLIPVFVALLIGEGTRLAGFLLMAAVVATDWVDGIIARRTGQVTELGKLLDPVADRLALGAALVTLAALDLFPWWAAGVVLGRDAAILVAGAYFLFRHGIRIDVRTIGKYATFTLMWGIPMIAWGNAGLPLDDLLVVLGWVWFPVGTIEYYAAGAAYARDLREALRARRSESGATASPER
ncbi:MAG TPA: CDP-alcohol phosphatidyltransferase family protein [Actinomycetota bacterium]|nr:CDP-alcohol phosphatidyltransferase family protein [Actinomycetota bacterium]